VDFAYVNNVEVIKGPAATMYGGGVGAVRFYTRPDFTKGLPFQKMQCWCF
jgi:iron complex outermembrane receptor protein